MDLIIQRNFRFCSIIESCHKKCIPTSYADPELNKAESVCIDRCVAKYIQTNMNAGKEFSAHMLQQQQNMAGK